MKYLSLLAILNSSMALATPNFPQGPVEHVGPAKADIVHCLNESVEARQFCRLGWGPAYDKLQQVSVPSAYAVELLILDSTPTLFGTITSEMALSRLRGSLREKYQMVPELQFMLEWSHDQACWQHGVLALEVKVISKGKPLGIVSPGTINYNFPLTTPLNEEFWELIKPDSQHATRVNWKQPNSQAIHAEFDFVDPDLRNPLISRTG